MKIKDKIIFRFKKIVTYHPVKRSLNIFKNSIQLYRKHDTSTQGAALSYFTILSIAPMLLIIISIAGVVLGPDAIQGEVKKQVQGLVGPESAVAIENIIKSAYHPRKNTVYTIVAVIILILGSTGVFGQLRTALNTIWEIKPVAKKPIVEYFLSKLFSFAMIGGLTFLMLVSLVIQSGLAAFSGYLSQRLPGISVILFKGIDIVLSVGVTTLLFTFIFKYLSDARPKWHHVWWGALFTTLLFGLGKYLIGLYLGQINFATTYGAGGSIILILVWVFYSSQIVFFGAEFTHAIAIENGISLDARAMVADEDAGINTKLKKVLRNPVKKDKPFRK